MDDWVIWLVAAVILAAGEIATTSFFLAPFAIGAFLAAIVALVGAPAAVAWGLFAVATVGDVPVRSPRGAPTSAAGPGASHRHRGADRAHGGGHAAA